MRFQSGFNCSKKAYLVNLPAPDSHSVLVEQPVVEAKEKTPDDLRVSSEEESTVLSKKDFRRPNTSEPTGRHIFTHFPKDPDWEVCKLTDTTRALCRNCPEARGDRIHLPQKIGDGKMVDSKVVKEEERISFYSIVAQTWRRTFFFLIQCYPTKNKIAQETMTNLQKFLPPDQKPGMINTETSLEFIRACEDFCWNHDKSTPCRSETNEIAESAVRRKTGVPLLFWFSRVFRKVVGENDGMLLLFAKQTRTTERQNVTV